jgi:hypothetical protein
VRLGRVAPKTASFQSRIANSAGHTRQRRLAAHQSTYGSAAQKDGQRSGFALRRLPQPASAFEAAQIRPNNPEIGGRSNCECQSGCETETTTRALYQLCRLSFRPQFSPLSPFMTELIVVSCRFSSTFLPIILVGPLSNHNHF